MDGRRMTRTKDAINKKNGRTQPQAYNGFVTVRGNNNSKKNVYSSTTSIEVVYKQAHSRLVGSIPLVVELVYGLVGYVLVVLKSNCVVAKDVVCCKATPVQIQVQQFASTALESQVPEEERWAVLWYLVDGQRVQLLKVPEGFHNKLEIIPPRVDLFVGQGESLQDIARA